MEILRNIVDDDDLINLTQNMDAVMDNWRRCDKMLCFIKIEEFLHYMTNTK